MERSKRLGFSLSLPFVFWLSLCLIGPLIFIVLTSFASRGLYGDVVWEFTGAAYADLLNPVYLKIVGRTLGFAAANTILVLFIAYPFAFYVTRLQGRARMFWLLVILVPSWTNFLVRIHAVSDFLRLRPLFMDWMYEPHGIVYTMVYEYLPLGVLPLYAALSKIDNSLIEAARDLGARSRDIFFKVLLPLTKSGVFAAGVFVFIPSLGEYLIPVLIGGGKYFVLGNFLDSQFMKTRNWPLGSAFLSVILLITFVVVVFSGDEKSEVA
jgi:spermidine/putrescine transport system permease protein